ncbi:hypothetical protein ERW49_18225 [Aliivibrio finisterrensis]|uniref:Uncharacterized protein n=1 Tax=Aliivibrio finisterrensis TaxID=511998 RepID=A0A4Q5KBA8_9GAMM|nr:hypothetical protein [Aliivibrio finisterrensis]RYU42115.1 hypothetical protein ERW49_18225 [Aliivibrio finisterrensis]
MIKISKVLTLDKIEIFNSLVNCDGNVNRIDYFSLGEPILDPPCLRGTIIIDFNFQFLLDNQDYFDYGSPIDVGSIKFGFIKINSDVERFIESTKCNYNKFFNVIEKCSFKKSPFDMLSNHIFSMEYLEIIENYFQLSVVDLIKKSNDPHTWLFEFCLKEGYQLELEHINKIFIPNTYLFMSPFLELNKINSQKIVTYNPKYGIESYVR